MVYDYKKFLRSLGKIQIINGHQNYYYYSDDDDIISDSNELSSYDYLMDYNYRNIILFMFIILANFLFLGFMYMFDIYDFTKFSFYHFNDYTI
jgi:hypothetical protein